MNLAVIVDPSYDHIRVHLRAIFGKAEAHIARRPHLYFERHVFLIGRP